MRTIFDTVNNVNANTSLYLCGKVNDTAQEQQVIENRAIATAQTSVGEVTGVSSVLTTLNGKAVLKIVKNIVPRQPTDYLLDEITICLTANVRKGSVVHPAFADLQPVGLDYASENDHFVFLDQFGVFAGKIGKRLPRNRLQQGE